MCIWLSLSRFWKVKKPRVILMLSHDLAYQGHRNRSRRRGKKMSYVDLGSSNCIFEWQFSETGVKLDIRFGKIFFFTIAFLSRIMVEQKIDKTRLFETFLLLYHAILFSFKCDDHMSHFLKLQISNHLSCGCSKYSEYSQTCQSMCPDFCSRKCSHEASVHTLFLWEMLWWYFSSSHIFYLVYQGRFQMYNVN